MRSKFISIVMPIFNEAKYIQKCLDSLLDQDYPREKMEWLFVDGGSVDGTLDVLQTYSQNFPGLISVLHNPKRTVPYAMNIGIAAAKGAYIIRLDAHAEYANNYFSKCVELLERTGADNVGGVMETKAITPMGHIIAEILSSKFGVGNSQFRTNGNDGYVDTVPFGAFRREVFESLGGYNEQLTRNQDNEMNYRIRKNGGKVFMSREIKLAYYSRESIKGLTEMAFQNGKWNVITSKLCPGTMGIRHFIPLVFLLSHFFLPTISAFLPFVWWLYALECLLYLALDIIASLGKHFLVKIWLFPLFHLSYGFGSLIGLFQLGEFR